MAIKVIKKGNLDSAKSAKKSVQYKVVCPSCGTVFTFTREDCDTLVKSINANPFGTIKCPECGCTIYCKREHEVK